MNAQTARLTMSVYGDDGFVDSEPTPREVVTLLDEMEAGHAIEASIYNPDPFVHTPRLHIERYPALGYVVMVFEDERSVGSYPTSGERLGRPEIPIELGGQALEKWPRELFVPREIASRALLTFVESGLQDASLSWVANDVFEREVIWEIR